MLFQLLVLWYSTILIDQVAGNIATISTDSSDNCYNEGGAMVLTSKYTGADTVTFVKWSYEGIILNVDVSGCSEFGAPVTFPGSGRRTPTCDNAAKTYTLTISQLESDDINGKTWGASFTLSPVGSSTEDTVQITICPSPDSECWCLRPRYHILVCIVLPVLWIVSGVIALVLWWCRPPHCQKGPCYPWDVCECAGLHRYIKRCLCGVLLIVLGIISMGIYVFYKCKEPSNPSSSATAKPELTIRGNHVHPKTEHESDITERSTDVSNSDGHPYVDRPGTTNSTERSTDVSNSDVHAVVDIPGTTNSTESSQMKPPAGVNVIGKRQTEKPIHGQIMEEKPQPMEEEECTG